jgi:hypothetical protein
MWITNYLKGKMRTISDTINYDNNHLELDNSINSDYSTTAKDYSCWCLLFIDEVKIEARILHNGRGKFKIVEDKFNAKYVNKIVDASEVIRCKVKPSDLHKFERQVRSKIRKPIPRYILCSRCSSKIISFSSPPTPLP